MAHGDGQRAGARTRAAAHAGRAGGGAPWAGLDGHKPIQPAQWLYAGLEPGAQQLSCKQAALRAPAKSPAPHWSRKLRLSEKFRRCLDVSEGRLVRAQRVQGMKPGQCKGSQAQEAHL